VVADAETETRSGAELRTGNGVVDDCRLHQLQRPRRRAAPLRLPALTATRQDDVSGSVGAFFFVVNWLKLGPYAWLGQLDSSNLTTSLVLAPLAPLGIALGAWRHHRVDEKIFFRFVYASLVVLGLKLIRDGLVGA